ncbi:MAG: hypothetical protein AMXMBFR80_10600 [Dehalococcoidia bacterium]
MGEHSVNALTLRTSGGHFLPLTVNLRTGTFVPSNNSGNAGGIDMVIGKMFAATARGDASIR